MIRDRTIDLASFLLFQLFHFAYQLLIWRNNWLEFVCFLVDYLDIVCKVCGNHEFHDGTLQELKKRILDTDCAGIGSTLTWMKMFWVQTFLILFIFHCSSETKELETC